MNFEDFQKRLEEGKHLQDILGFTPSMMAEFYEAASRLFEKQMYSESADAFVFLSTLNPRIDSYWIGLGMSEQMNNNYNDALIAYSMAILLNGRNPLPHYHSAACYYGLKDDVNTRVCLEMALEFAEEGSEIHAQASQAAKRLNYN